MAKTIFKHSVKFTGTLKLTHDDCAGLLYSAFQQAFTSSKDPVWKIIRNQDGYDAVMESMTPEQASSAIDAMFPQTLLDANALNITDLRDGYWDYSKNQLVAFRTWVAANYTAVPNKLADELRDSDKLDRLGELERAVALLKKAGFKIEDTKKVLGDGK